MTNNKIKIAFHNFGCKVNFTELAYIQNNLDKNTFSIVNKNENPDFIVINSCCVTKNAEIKAKYLIRQIKKNNPNTKIILIGCLTEKPNYSNNNIDFILNNKNKYNLQQFLKNNISQHDKQSEKNEFTLTWSTSQRTRAFLKIQEGCNYFCSYCIIPYVRGTNRSASINDVVNTANKITQQGFKEIVLTGINLGEFGKKNNETLTDLIIKLSQIDELKRIRISSIEPNLITDDLLTLFQKNSKLMPHFHIPLQSGSNKILKLMNRRYDTTLFENVINKINLLIPNACIAIDIIVGFPYETDNDFNDSLQFLQKLNIAYMHIFPFSPREYTKAALFNNQVPDNEKKKRVKIMQQLSNSKMKNFCNQFINTSHNVLFETITNNNYLIGHTPNYLKVISPLPKNLINNIINVKLTKFDHDKFIFYAIPNNTQHITNS